jgi:hypothetical protein
MIRLQIVSHAETCRRCVSHPARRSAAEPVLRIVASARLNRRRASRSAEQHSGLDRHLTTLVPEIFLERVVARPALRLNHETESGNVQI